jgi:hypothetical protein
MVGLRNCAEKSERRKLIAELEEIIIHAEAMPPIPEGIFEQEKDRLQA